MHQFLALQRLPIRLFRPNGLSLPIGPFSARFTDFISAQFTDFFGRVFEVLRDRRHLKPSPSSGRAFWRAADRTFSADSTPACSEALQHQSSFGWREFGFDRNVFGFLPTKVRRDWVSKLLSNHRLKPTIEASD